MKPNHLLLLMFLVPTFGNASEPEPHVTTSRFEFYNNFWINQHHFLYKVAEWVVKDSLDAPAEHQVFAEVKKKDRQAINSCVAYYQSHLIDKNLLFNNKMHEIKRTLIHYGKEDQLPVGDIDTALVEILQAFRPIYSRYFWEKHSQRNLAVLNRNIDRIKRFENKVFGRLAELAQDQWVDGRFRIDLTYYANWAGAYTSNKPTHAVISTHQEEPEGSWVETVFHESAHSLISSRRGTISEVIAAAAEKLGKKPPRGLWHSIQFYFVGRTVQDLLQAQGVTYEQIMVRGEIFSRHYPALVKWMEPYLQGESTLQAAVEKLVEAL